MNRRELKLYMKSISKLYGCTVSFGNIVGGRAYLNGHILVGTNMTKSWIVSVFCHELAHHCNQIDGKFKSFHDGNVGWMKSKDIEKSCAYAYKAEQYTDRIGKKICSLWFPEYKYETFYDGSDYSRGFTYGHYFNLAG